MVTVVPPRIAVWRCGRGTYHRSGFTAIRGLEVVGALIALRLGTLVHVDLEEVDINARHTDNPATEIQLPWLPRISENAPHVIAMTTDKRYAHHRRTLARHDATIGHLILNH